MSKSLAAVVLVSLALGAMTMMIHFPPSQQGCLSKNPSWSEATCERVSKGEVELGMTKEQARAALGRPRDVNTTETARSHSEQWVYGEAPHTKYLYFEDGILETIQD